MGYKQHKYIFGSGAKDTKQFQPLIEEKKINPFMTKLKKKKFKEF